MTDRILFDSALTEAASAIGVCLKEPHLARMWQHFTLMVEANRHFNLTRITTPADAAVKHYADSLSLLATPWVDRDRPLAVLDVGTGAGFPAVPLAVLCEKWCVTAIDGTGKKVRFVADAAKAMGLANLTAVHARAADLAREGRTKFDLVILRAVAKIAPGICEVHSLIKPTGAAVFYKSGDLSEEELAAGTAAARQRGLLACATHALQLSSATEPLERRLVRYSRK